MQLSWSEILQFSQSLTQRVGDTLSQEFGIAQAQHKADGSLVTSCDEWADEQIRSAIAQQFPDHGVLTEETVHIFPDTEWCWIIDPIDGTTNFARGIPIWGISLGLLYRGMPVFGYVYFPNLKQSFHGFWLNDSGLDGENGAYCNGSPIHSSADEPSENHLFSLCARSNTILKQSLPCKSRVVGVCTYSFLLVATGAVLGSVEAIPKVWDLAGVWPIIQAAGGQCVPLTNHAIFPLTVGEDYGKKLLPTLVMSRSELGSVFEPLMQPVKHYVFPKAPEGTL